MRAILDYSLPQNRRAKVPPSSWSTDQLPFSEFGINKGHRMNLRLVLAALLSAGLAACGGSSTATPGTPPAAPTIGSPTAGDRYVLIPATYPADATGANLYWSKTPGVVKSASNKIAVGASPQAHTSLDNGQIYYYVITAVNAGGESAASSEVSATPAPSNGTYDPLYGDQWNLKSDGTQLGQGSTAAAGEDINVEPAWATRKGTGVRIAIVDDGLEIGHEDLASNVGPNGTSHNYVTNTADPTNDPDDPNQVEAGHGTACAGIAAARDLNDLGVRGVAPRAELVGYNLLLNSTSTNETDAMIRNAASVSVSSNSWGAPDGTGKLAASDQTWRDAINTGLTSGRNNLGTIYTWAAGNGRQVSVRSSGVTKTLIVDNSNYDGQANYFGVMAIAAVDDQGLQAPYSESGANLWVSAPGGKWCDTHTITTTDRTGSLGPNTGPTNTVGDYNSGSYTRCMNGTSSATPTVAGVAALVLEANPTLTWRDVRAILAQSARKNDTADTGWYNTGAGFHFNHKYGYGVVNAGYAVEMAGTWTNFPAQKTYSPTSASPNSVIPDNSMTGVPSTITIQPGTSGISKIEFIDVTFSAADHTYLGDLTVTLTSPSGTTTYLAEAHPCVDKDVTNSDDSHPLSSSCGTPYAAWRFGDAGHLGEAADGTWTLRVYDLVSGDTGTFQSWGLKFYGH